MIAEKALRHLIDEFDFDFEDLLKASSMEKGLNISFSEVKYKHIAPSVGLDPLWHFYDAPVFDLNRSRIPTALFKDIVADMDTLVMQFGTLKPTLRHRQITEDARSRVLAPIFNRLVTEFAGSILNTLESFASGRITRDRVDYHFRTCNILTVVFVQVDLQVGGDDARADAIALVIEECDAGNQFNRRQSVSAPIYGILYDGIRFRFFIFDGSTKPYKFSEGVVPGSHVQNIGLRLEDFSSKHDADPFVLGLRPICETIFNFFLVTYIATLKESRERTRIAQHERVGSLAQWDQAINLAEEALEKSLHAEACRQNNSIIDADATAETALKALKRSTDFVPNAFKIDHLMDIWDDDKLSKV
ncbi:hypothetical protein V8E53_005012 [Lactarius tabidus]